MRVVYVAKHNSGGNDDEGAVHDALLSLGHTVERLKEQNAHNVHKLDGDFVLFHHLPNPRTLERSPLPKVFWYFDHVNCDRRRAWMAEAMAVSKVGLCTDGDWAEQHKLVWLTQGADQRVLGGDLATFGNSCLFTGGTKGRESWLDSLLVKPTVVKKGVHGREMANLIAAHTLCLAPDFPVTDKYWSNRVYNTLGFGGCLLHPYAARLFGHYESGLEILFYRSRDEMRQMIEHYVNAPVLCAKIGLAGLERTKRDHTYVNRVQSLISQVKARL